MLSPGDRFDCYVVEGVLGQGGMGIVYRALDPKLGRRVALKIVALSEGGSTPDAQARLLREARAAAAFDHPNAVSVFDVGEHEGRAYLAMELVPGKTLRALVGDPSVPVNVRVGWLADVARALAAAHRVGLVHRDVKPENVIVRDDGVVKVLDFGIARRASGAIDPTAPTASALATITAEGVAVGTPLYMAPEQLRGGAIDGRSDQFSWGVVAYELLAGRSPWGASGDLLALAAAIASEEAKPLGESSRGVPPAVASVVMRALRKTPSDRFASMGAIVEVLDATRTGGATARVEPWSWRPWAIGAAVIAAVGIVAIGVARTRGATTSEAPATSASSEDAGALAPPTPTNAKPEAIEAYREALTAMRGGEGSRYVSLLQRAVAVDPGFSEALTRLALLPSENGTNDARELVSRAGARRDTLAPRDAAVLRAVEALYARDPLDTASFERELAAAVRGWPRDAELRLLHAHALEEEARHDDASRELDCVAEIDTSFAAAWHERAAIAFARGDTTRARALAGECIARFPRATACMHALEDADEIEGRCADVEADARRQLAVDPDAYTSYATLVEALASEGRPRDVTMAAFAQAVALRDPAIRDAYRQAGGWQIEVTYGNFEVADAMARSYVEAHPTDVELGSAAFGRRFGDRRRDERRARRGGALARDPRPRADVDEPWAALLRRRARDRAPPSRDRSCDVRSRGRRVASAPHRDVLRRRPRGGGERRRAVRRVEVRVRGRRGVAGRLRRRAPPLQRRSLRRARFRSGRRSGRG